jgi:hypothetical protein
MDRRVATDPTDEPRSYDGRDPKWANPWSPSVAARQIPWGDALSVGDLDSGRLQVVCDRTGGLAGLGHCLLNMSHQTHSILTRAVLDSGADRPAIVTSSKTRLTQAVILGVITGSLELPNHGGQKPPTRFYRL